MGIDHIFETALPGKKPLITVKEWKAILDYYLNAAPGTLPGQGRPVFKTATHFFTVTKTMVPEGNIPATSFIKIDEGNHWIYAANTFDFSVNIYSTKLKLIARNMIGAAAVDFNFNSSLQEAGLRDGVFTNIGIMNPNDRATGTAESFQLDKKGNLIERNLLFDSIPRPVQITKADLDNDGRQDYVICGFGNTTGALYWMKSLDSNRFEKKILSPFPGAIRSYVDDFNKDGLPDIMVLMAQSREGIFIYLNKTNGLFETRQLLAFPPVFGSSYFDLVDFNKDGYQDILYTCGDNDDYSSILKYYHGVYIYLNDGKNNFKQKYFFPIHGCYKAMARDFDKDGDLDIAAISFFPDTSNQPQESFVYLEQTSPFIFSPYGITAFDEGRWMTMDAGDLDGDGYDDIVLGSLIPPIPGKVTEWKKSNKQKAAILLLHNEGGSLNKKR
ncbi:MAG: VCBS repeat-containing protein [Ferruginibacter sp.]